ncbi:hypothetical protein TRFO_13815 [Tritrichomonas foetus]|uniref:Glycosyltransferase 61 catalytic domain-containing protein n=1 Tax=Tritrichomonas foetus TaxID=1144522 RepID=A0A1J4KX97_9EUKA|nr:hypothetical protein TRFO_13815 [Tritrichomonas foetus]|eukprot:OHT15802.1 hypothetical protein TRFO_13815 [Tritrichomonas foetus]
MTGPDSDTFLSMFLISNILVFMYLISRYQYPILAEDFIFCGPYKHFHMINFIPYNATSRAFFADCNQTHLRLFFKPKQLFSTTINDGTDMPPVDDVYVVPGNNKYFLNRKEYIGKNKYSTFDFVKIYNSVAGEYCSIYTKRGFMFFHRWHTFEVPQNGTFDLTHCHSILALCNEHSCSYGHWYIDYAPMLIFFPTIVLRTSIIPYIWRAPYVHEMIEYFPVQLHQFVLTGDRRLYHASNLYLVLPLHVFELHAKLLYGLKLLLMRVFGLGHSLPFRFVFYNRESFRSRHIANAQELVHLAHRISNNITFELSRDRKGIAGQAYYFNQIYFLWCLHGSVMSNFNFMNEKSIIVEVNTYVSSGVIVRICQICQLYIVEGQDRNIPHFIQQHYHFSSMYFQRVIKMGINLINESLFDSQKNQNHDPTQ